MRASGLLSPPRPWLLPEAMAETVPGPARALNPAACVGPEPIRRRRRPQQSTRQQPEVSYIVSLTRETPSPVRGSTPRRLTRRRTNRPTNLAQAGVRIEFD